MGHIYIRGHHLDKFRVTAVSFPDQAPDELADEWIRGIDNSAKLQARYLTLNDPQVRQAMRDGFVSHIRNLRAGLAPVIVEGDDAALDPICASCINAWCGDSTVYRNTPPDATIHS